MRLLVVTFTLCLSCLAANAQDSLSTNDSNILLEKETLSLNKEFGYCIQFDTLHYFGAARPIKLNLQRSNYLAVFDKSTMNYTYYPASFKVNVNLFSPRVAGIHYNATKIDSFNPYGSHKPGDAIVLGAVDYFLQQILK